MKEAIIGVVVLVAIFLGGGIMVGYLATRPAPPPAQPAMGCKCCKECNCTVCGCISGDDHYKSTKNGWPQWFKEPSYKCSVDCKCRRASVGDSEEKKE